MSCSQCASADRAILTSRKLSQRLGQTGQAMTGDTFRERREFLGYSQRAFAERLGLSERTIRYYESGEVPINRTVELLLQAVELDEK